MEHEKRLAWLVRKSGSLAGARHLLRGPVSRVGRSPDSDVVMEGEEAAVVSARHLEIRKQGADWLLYDLASTNGTYVNGERVTDVVLGAAATIRLGADGPELAFLLDEAPAEGPGETVVLLPLALPPLSRPQPGGPAAGDGGAAPSAGRQDEQILSDAVARARRARRAGIGNQTLRIMREVLSAALDRTGRRLRAIIGVLIAALVALSAGASWKIAELKGEKQRIDRQIQDLESALGRGGQDDTEQARLIERLEQFQNQGLALQGDMFYRWGVEGSEESLRRAIRALMAEFGAEVYSIPPEFLEQVHRFILQYRGPDRPHMARALGQARQQLDAMREVFRQEHLPPDLAFMVLVESAFLSESASRAGAVGLWQFTPATARAYGLRVAPGIDERLDPRKATRAGCKYIRQLILDFGSGSSVMLALAAYNLGPGKVRQAVRKVSDPIRQRNFWYLYRIRALPAETREYVPKVIAAMIIGRHPEQFGF